MPLNDAQAQRGLAAAFAKANEVNCPCSIAVLDTGGNVVAFRRMDRSPLASVEVSQAKAYTAVSLNISTAELNSLVQPGAPYYGIENSHRHPMIVFAGGIPLREDGSLIGAVGVGGGTLDQDVAIASAAVEAMVG